jgi:hypothetical protein
MALPARFSQLGSDLDPFLFALIGEEKSGMALSVASALARLGIDPWNESRRLAEMPSAKATEILASMVASLSLARSKPSDAPGIAARLVALLPTNGGDAPFDSGSTAPRTARKIRSSGRLRWLYLALVLVALAYVVTDLKPTLHAQGALAVLSGTISP